MQFFEDMYEKTAGDECNAIMMRPHGCKMSDCLILGLKLSLAAGKYVQENVLISEPSV